MDKKMKWIIVIVAAAAVVVLGTWGGIHFTSQTEFCNSCHEMNTAFAGWEGGVHQGLHCYNCHTDPGVINELKIKANGLKEVYIHLTQDVNMDEVVADVPSNRCLECHDLTDKEKYSEKTVAYHAQHHDQLGFECIECHRPVGHTNNTFDGFKNDACKQCHGGSTAPQSTSPAPTGSTGQSGSTQGQSAPADTTKPSTETDTTKPTTGSSTSGSSSTSGGSKPTDTASTPTSSTPTSSTPTTSAPGKPVLNLGHALDALHENCAMCHAGGNSLSQKPPHGIDASTGKCDTCHTLKPKA